MALLGQASGGFTESSSALRILHVGVRNTIGVLTEDSFTQTNPPVTTAANAISQKADTQVFGVLSGSVAFTRPDAGSNFIGGPASGVQDEEHIRAVGVFINTAVGNAFENQAGPASGKGPYVSAQGTYGNALYETQAIATAGGLTQGDDLTYVAGMDLMASLNGYLMPRSYAAYADLDLADFSAEIAAGSATTGNSTIIGVLKMPPDSTMDELVYDQRI